MLRETGKANLIREPKALIPLEKATRKNDYIFYYIIL